MGCIQKVTRSPWLHHQHSSPARLQRNRARMLKLKLVQALRGLLVALQVQRACLTDVPPVTAAASADVPDGSFAAASGYGAFLGSFLTKSDLQVACCFRDFSSCGHGAVRGKDIFPLPQLFQWPSGVHGNDVLLDPCLRCANFCIAGLNHLYYGMPKAGAAVVASPKPTMAQAEVHRHVALRTVRFLKRLDEQWGSCFDFARAVQQVEERGVLPRSAQLSRSRKSGSLAFVIHAGSTAPRPRPPVRLVTSTCVVKMWTCLERLALATPQVWSLLTYGALSLTLKMCSQSILGWTTLLYLWLARTGASTSSSLSAS